MTKKQLLRLLEGVSDDSNIFVITEDYDEDDDCTWMPENQPELLDVRVIEGEAHLVIEGEG